MTSRAILTIVVAAGAVLFGVAQTRPRTPPARSKQTATAAAAKYSVFLHSSDKHKGLACNACHKIPTAWNARRDFPDVADFPDHDSCVRCHRQQFFTRQAFSNSGPTICTICHLRAAPRADARFAFGKPNNSSQALKPKEERQFTIEFPHDKHQNVIAALQSWPRSAFKHASFSPLEEQKPDYNNCSICHATNNSSIDRPAVRGADSFEPPRGTFKTAPATHDACFNCHWKNQKPAGADCSGCHKPAATFVPPIYPKRISARFSHEGGKGEHVLECTTCHINITRASSLRGLTPDVPIAACTACHKDSRKTTYPKAVTIEEEFEQFKRTGACTYCHTADVGMKKAPASHDAAAQ
jgi:Outer membrane cytochrome MtrC/MtrF-like, domains II/IV